MKKFIAIIISLLIIQIAKAQLTQVVQLTDISTKDSCFEAVRALVERFGVLGTEEQRQGNKYLPQKMLTRRSFAIVMANSLDQIQELFAGFAVNATKKAQDSMAHIFKEERFKGYADAPVKKMKNSAGYTDTNKKDKDFIYIKKLTDKYRMRLGDEGNKFSPEKLMSSADINTIFRTYFGAKGVVKKPGLKPITRGTWSKYLAQLLETLIDDIFMIIDGKEEEEKEKEKLKD